MRTSGHWPPALLPAAFGAGLAGGQIAILLAAELLAGGAPGSRLPDLAGGMILAGLLAAGGLAAASVSSARPGRAGSGLAPAAVNGASPIAQAVRDAVATLDLPAPAPATD